MTLDTKEEEWKINPSCKPLRKVAVATDVNNMAIIYKPLALLKAEAIARYEKKETMLHLQPIVKDERVTAYCQDLISQIKTVHVYYTFDQEWFEMECLGSVVGSNGRTFQILRIDGKIVRMDLLFQNHCWCLGINSSLYIKLCNVMDWVICSTYTSTH